MTVPFMYNFRRSSDKVFEYNFSQFTTQVRLFFVGRKKPTIFGLKYVMKRGIRNQSKSAADSPKSVFNVFKRKRLLGAPVKKGF